MLSSGHVDASHPAVVDWLAEAEGERDEREGSNGAEPTTPEGDLAALAARAEQYGGLARYVALSTAARHDAQRRLAELKVGALSGRYLEADFVARYVVSHLVTLRERLLHHVSSTLAVELESHYASKGTREGARKLLQKHFVAALRRTRDQVVQSIEVGRRTCSTDPPEPEPPPPPNPPPDITLEAQAAIEAHLQRETAPRVVQSVAKAAARAAAGKPWRDAAFADAMTLLPEIEADCINRVAHLMSTHVQTAVREYRDRPELDASTTHTEDPST